MEDLKFECDAWGCEEKIEREGGLCKHHIRRYVESKRPGAPVFLRKSQNGGGPKKAPLDLSTGSGRAGESKEAGMKCSRCGRSSNEARKFNKKRGLCISCCMTLNKAKREGKEPPPLKGKKKDAGEGTASLKKGKIYGKGKDSLTPTLSLKGRGKKEPKGKRGKKTKRPKSQIPPALPLEKRGVPEPPLDLRLTLDFSGYPVLFGIIESRAQDDFRTPEMQALFILKEALK